MSTPRRCPPCRRRRRETRRPRNCPTSEVCLRVCPSASALASPARHSSPHGYRRPSVPARGEFPFLFGRQTLARPLRVGVRVVPRDARDRMPRGSGRMVCAVPTLRGARVVLRAHEVGILLAGHLVLVDKKRCDPERGAPDVRSRRRSLSSPITNSPPGTRNMPAGGGGDRSDLAAIRFFRLVLVL